MIFIRNIKFVFLLRAPDQLRLRNVIRHAFWPYREIVTNTVLNLRNNFHEGITFKIPEFFFNFLTR